MTRIYWRSLGEKPRGAGHNQTTHSGDVGLGTYTILYIYLYIDRGPEPFESTEQLSGHLPKRTIVYLN